MYHLFGISDLEIGQPSFSSSVGGLASYAAYPIPGAIHNSMEIKFKFIPSTIEQIALMVFVGQDGFHDSRADHLSVSFIKGYVVLTWNLGSGTVLAEFSSYFLLYRPSFHWFNIYTRQLYQ